MNIFTIAICDDEPNCCEQIVRIIKTHPSSQNFRIKIFYSGEELCNFIYENHYEFDLIILDIKLKSMNGVEVGEILRQPGYTIHSALLYISSDCSYASALFDLHPVNFLTKPVSPTRLLSNIDYTMKHAKTTTKFFSYEFSKGVYKIPYSEIVFFESEARRIKIGHIDKEKEIYFYEKLDNVAEEVCGVDFIRIHYSFIVNWRYVRKVFAETVELSNGMSLSVSRNYKKTVQEFSMEFLRRK